jgi:hypothetical protein
MAEAGAYFFSRLHQQTTIYETGAGRLTPMARVRCLKTVQGTPLEQALCMGATDQGGARRIACRVPETSVHDRRSKARKNAKKTGHTPSHAHLTLFAWPLCIPTVPCTIGKTETGSTGSPVRWQIERMFTSWKSSLH